MASGCSTGNSSFTLLFNNHALAITFISFLLGSCSSKPARSVDIFLLDSPNKRVCKDVGNPATCVPLDKADRWFVLEAGTLIKIGEALESNE